MGNRHGNGNGKALLCYSFDVAFTPHDLSGDFDGPSATHGGPTSPETVLRGSEKANLQPRFSVSLWIPLLS